jgi:hypothetical protein
MDDQEPEILRPEPTFEGGLDKIGRGITLLAEGCGDLGAVVGPIINRVHAAFTARSAANTDPQVASTPAGGRRRKHPAIKTKQEVPSSAAQ